MQNKKSSKPFQKGRKFKKYQNKIKGSDKPKDDEEIERIRSQLESIDPSKIKNFNDFPLSWRTQKGIREANFKVPTNIQRDSIGYALQGRDILGAAQTGSGKTLAFLIPVIENLFMNKWTRLDGVGAIIISPTRELAYQIFETLKKIGAHHDFSAGLIIGGKNLKFERKRMDQCNIIICTPGRLLQHMDENPLFDASTMQILVLDEADRCLDMGFEQTMNGIIENLPPKRQTLLFSATQTKSVKDLARLSLDNEVYVAPTEQQAVTPDNLKQNYVVVNLEDKITMIWSFIKSHLKQKCVVFLASCKQVKYIYEIFCKLRPGTSLLALYGTLHQDRRVAIYQDFCRKSNVVLFATDIASRGLDFPTINWVVQMDCPEDVTQYIHRAGRTARHKARGESLLVLLPSEEEAMVAELKAAKIEIDQIHIDPKKLFSPRAKIEGLLAQNKELKESAQRAFGSYIKSVFVMKNKKIFSVEKLNTDEYAKSLGLVVVPRVRFLECFKARRAAAQKKTIQEDSEESSSSEEDSENSKQAALVKKDDEVNFNIPSLDDSDNSDAEEQLFKIKRRDHDIEESDSQNKDDDDAEKAQAELSAARKAKILTKAALAKRVLKKRIQTNTKIEFNEDGTEMLDTRKQLQSDLARNYANQDEGGIDIETVKKVLREEDKFDKQRFKEKVKAKHKVQKKKSKSKKNEDENDEEVDDFGSDEDDQHNVDLSWLPDPNKYYNVVNSDSDSDSDSGGNANSDDEEENESESLVHRPPKRLYEKKRKSDKTSMTSSESDSNDETENEPRQKKAKQITDKLSLNEAEMIAMQLLGK